MTEEMELGLFEEDRRVFLGWNRPLLAEVVAWLWDRREELTGILLVVPTAQSGRRLRESLAVHAAEQGHGGVLAPRVITQEGLWPQGDELAGRGGELLAWMEVLENIDDLFVLIGQFLDTFLRLNILHPAFIPVVEVINEAVFINSIGCSLIFYVWHNT